MRRIASTCFWLTLAAASSGAETTLIRNATVLTVTKGTVENGSVLIEGGKIVAVGANVSAPSGATVVNGTGRYLMPGIIDCHSHTAVEGMSMKGAFRILRW